LIYAATRSFHYDTLLRDCLRQKTLLERGHTLADGRRRPLGQGCRSNWRQHWPLHGRDKNILPHFFIIRFFIIRAILGEIATRARYGPCPRLDFPQLFRQLGEAHPILRAS